MPMPMRAFDPQWCMLKTSSGLKKTRIDYILRLKAMYLPSIYFDIRQQISLSLFFTSVSMLVEGEGPLQMTARGYKSKKLVISYPLGIVLLED